MSMNPVAAFIISTALAATTFGAHAEAPTCSTPGHLLERDVDDVARQVAPVSLFRAIQTDDFQKAQLYGYLIGRRLETSRPGTAYHDCALAADKWLTIEFGRFSNEVLTTYRGGLAGDYDFLMEVVHLIDTEFMNPKTRAAKPAPQQAKVVSSTRPQTTAPGERDVMNEEYISLETAKEEICPTGGDPEYSAAWLRFQRWMEIEYLHGESSYDMRWTDKRYMLGHAMARLNMVIADHPLRRAAFKCISDQVLELISRVEATGHYDGQQEMDIVQAAFQGKHDDMVRKTTGVTEKKPAVSFLTQLEGDTGIDLSDGSFGSAIVPSRQLTPDAPPIAADLPPAPPATHPWDGICSRKALEENGYKPVFALINTIYANIYVYVDPVENTYVFLQGCGRKEWDWNGFNRDWEERDTVYPKEGAYYKIVKYKSRTRNDWTRIGYF